MSELKQQLEALRIDDADDRPRRWPFVVGALVLVLIALAVVGWRARASWAAVEVRTARSTLSRVARTDALDSPVLTASGYVVARRRAVVSAKIQGRLEELRVEEGSRVRQGEIIARLESRDYEAQVARAKARVVSARSQIARASAAVTRAEADLAEAQRQLRLREKLITERVVSADERDAASSRVTISQAMLGQATAEHEQAVADLAQADADVRLNEALYQNTLIRAPFTGTVVKKMAEVGESVAPIPPGVNISTASGAIVAVADLDTLEVEVDVSESNVARLVPQQRAEVTVEAFPDRRYRATLRQVIPTADRTKATVMVKVTILDKDENLKPEMSARVTFLAMPNSSARAATPEAPVVLVPQEAVVTRDGGPQVLEVVENRVKTRPIRLGKSERDQVIVLEGLNGGEQVVLTPPDDLRDGDSVRIKRGT